MTELDINIRNILEAYYKICKWLPPITKIDKDLIKTIAEGTENTIGVPLIKQYLKLLWPYIKHLNIVGNTIYNVDCIASGFIFFYGCLLYIMRFPNWAVHIEDIVLYNLLYIFVDYYIDSVRLSNEKKDIVIMQMSMLVKDPSLCNTIILEDPILHHITVIYSKLLQRCPQVKSIIIKLFNAELESLYIQRTKTLSRDSYYSIAINKGGYTTQVLQYIMGQEDPELLESSFELGCIMQLIDDSLDVLIDNRDNIYTVASYDLVHNGNLDKLWIDIVHRIDKLSNKFIDFKIMYTIFILYLPTRMKQNYTKFLYNLTNPYNLFDIDSALIISDMILSEITAIELLGHHT